MQTIDTEAGPLHVVSTRSDAADLWDWLQARSNQVLGLDFETNGVRNPFDSRFRQRLAQIADTNEGWIIRSGQPGMLDVSRDMTRMHPYWIAHFSENDIRFAECAAPGSIRLDQITPHVADLQPVLAWHDPRTVTSADKPGIDVRIRHPRGLKDTVVRLLQTDVLDRAETALHIRFLELSAKPEADVLAPKIVWDNLDLFARFAISATGAGVAVGRAFESLGIHSVKRTKKGSDCWNKDSLAEVASRDAGLASELARALLALRQMNSDCSRNIEDRKTYGFAHVPDDDPLYWAYGGLDAMMTVRLWHLMTIELKQRGQWPGVVDDLKLQWHIDLMTRRGMMIDGPYARWLDQVYADVRTDNAEHLAKHGIKSSASGPAVGRAFNTLGIHSPKKTDNGESWDKFVIGPIAEGKTDANSQAVDLAQKIRLVRGATKFRSSYTEPMLAGLAVDGRVHPSMRAIGAITSRNSESDPPIQQMPVRTDTRVRPCFRAPDGWVIVTADLHQGEPHVMAARSGDKNLARDLATGNINKALAALTFGAAFVPDEYKMPGAPSAEMYDRAKITFLARCYGAGIAKMADSLGVSYAEMAEIKRRWDTEYATLTRYEKHLNSLPYVTLDSGWRAPLWDRYRVGPNDTLILDPHKTSRLGLNYDTQGNQRVLVMNSALQLINQGWSWALYGFMHDEIVGSVPVSKAEEFRYLLKQAMTLTYKGIPITCSAEIRGQNWASKDNTGFSPAELLEEIEDDE